MSRSLRLLMAIGPVASMLIFGVGGIVLPSSASDWVTTIVALLAVPPCALWARARLAAERYISTDVAHRYRMLGEFLDRLGPGQHALATGGGLIVAVNEKTTTGSTVREYTRIDSTQETTATGGHVYDLYTLDTERPVVHHQIGETTMDAAERVTARALWGKFRVDMQLTRTGIDLVGVDELDLLVGQVREAIDLR